MCPLEELSLYRGVRVQQAEPEEGGLGPQGVFWEAVSSVTRALCRGLNGAARCSWRGFLRYRVLKATVTVNLPRFKIATHLHLFKKNSSNASVFQRKSVPSTTPWK